MDTSRQLFSHHSSTSGFINNTSTFGKDDNIKVVVRVRPLNQMEMTRGGRKCIKDQNPGENTIVLATQEAKQFTYDVVANQSISQQDLFRRVAMPVANQCLQGKFILYLEAKQIGYNGTIFAYGQTGAGKTYTIQGPTQHYRSQHIDQSQIGIMPRVFDFIFGHIEMSSLRGDVTFLVKCRYIQIYMEKIYDLLQPEMPQLQLREDLKRGVYVQNAIQEHVKSAKEALDLQRRGATNRHIGETAMNKQSSRSHSIFTLSIEQKQVKQDGLCNIRSCQFHLIDLAGSERQKKTGAEGERLKQASNINLSLTNLGTVINILSEGKQDHIPYRNSKITFLLRDSLGGNSKTVIVANISPSVLNLNETISTLNFAQRAKMIKNKAIINQDTTGTVSLLRQQIIRLKKRLSTFQNQGAPLSFIASPIPRRFASDFVDNDLLVDQQHQQQQQQQQQMQMQSVGGSILQNGGLNQRQMQLQALLIQNNELLVNQEKAYQNEIASKLKEIQELK